MVLVGFTQEGVGGNARLCGEAALFAAAWRVQVTLVTFISSLLVRLRSRRSAHTLALSGVVQQNQLKLAVVGQRIRAGRARGCW